MADTQFQPEWHSRPGRTLATLMQRRGISAKELSKNLGGSKQYLSQILSGTAKIDREAAATISSAVGGTISFWLERQLRYERDLDHAARSIELSEAEDWLRNLPLKEMRDSGWVRAAPDRMDALRATLAYFDVASPHDWRERYTTFESVFSYRTSPTFSSKIGSLAAWLRQGEIQASSLDCGTWDAKKFKQQLLAIRDLTKAKNAAYFVPRIQALCADVGVAVVFVRTPPGCRASGATRFLSRSKAMIILSFRYLSDDHFWFTFFHEAGHLLLHNASSTFVDSDTSEVDDREREANAFSSGMLIPVDRRDEMLALRPKYKEIVRFATNVGVSPGIVVGQLQHYGAMAPTQMNNLKRRYTWEQILSAIG